VVAILAMDGARSQTFANPITFSFNGSVTRVDGSLGSSIQVGDTINGRYSFDSAAPNLLGNPTSREITLSSISVSIDGSTWSSSSGHIGIGNLAPGGGPFLYGVDAEAFSGPSLNGAVPPQSMILGFASLTSTALPLTTSAFVSKSNLGLVLGFGNGGNSTLAGLVTLSDEPPLLPAI